MLINDYVRLNAGGAAFKQKVLVSPEALTRAGATFAEQSIYQDVPQARSAHIIGHSPETYTVFTKTSLIGCGAYSRVFAGVDQMGKTVVVKEMRRVPYLGHTKLRPPACDNLALNREWQVARALGERLRPTAAFSTPKRAYITLPAAHATAHDAAEMVRQTRQSSSSDMQLLGARVLQDVGGHLQRIHEKGYLHNDIKPDNIFLVAPQGAADASFELGDFGLSFSPAAGDAVGSNTNFGAPERVLGDLASASRCTDAALEYLFLRDEALKMRLDRLAKADVFSLGLSALLLVVGEAKAADLLPAFAAGEACEETSLAHYYTMFEHIRASRGATTQSIAQSSPACEVPQTFITAWCDVWERVEAKAPALAPLLRTMLHRDPEQRPDAQAAAVQAQAVGIANAAETRDMFERLCSSESRAQQQAAVSRRWWMATGRNDTERDGRCL